MPLTDHQKLMDKLAALGIQNSETAQVVEKPQVVQKTEVIEKPKVAKKRTSHMTGNQHAKKDETRDAVITVRVTKALKKAAAKAAYPGRLSAFVEEAIKTAVENKNNKPTQ